MKSRKIEIDANAKINLFLEVGLRRADGYHDVESVMQAVTLSDKVTVEAGDGVERGIALECDGLPTDRGNIAYRAAELFCRAAGIEPHVRIHIEKRIPVAAGLAGGSTDGAAVLRALRAIFGGVSTEELMDIAAGIGADVPFCVAGGTALARGIGERLTPCAPMPDCHILIAKRGEGVLTPEAYREIDRTREGDDAFLPRRAYRMLAALRSGDLDRVGARLYNAFGALSYAETLGANAIADICRSHGGYALLSGSGPSVFALFADEKDAAAAEVAVRAAYHDATVLICRPAGKNDDINI